MNRNNRRENTIVFSAIVLFVLFIQFWVSIDSFTHDLYGRCDDAWYFTGGRALMNGLTPYIDFTDVKGPILWIVYGLAYLLDSDSYLGVFWITVITYSITFIVCYKIFHYYVEQKTALLLVFILGFFYFIPQINYSTEVETFTQPFVAICLYSSLSIIRKMEGRVNGIIKYYSFLMGICVAIPFLMKFSIGVMIAIIPIAFFLLLLFLKQWRNSVEFALWVIAGFLLIAIPIWSYLLFRGSLDAYFYEVFVYTTQTVSVPTKELPGIYLQEWQNALSSPRIVFLLSVLSIPIVEKDKRAKLIYALCALFFFAVSIHADKRYYTNVCCVWSIYLILAVYRFLQNVGLLSRVKLTNKYALPLLLVFIPISIVYRVHPWSRPHFFTQSQNRVEYYRCASYIQQIHQPRILDYKCFEFGLGMLADALPACKRYALPFGYMPNDVKEQEECLRKRIADFVICEDIDANEVEKYGYKYICDYTRYENKWNSHIHFKLYSRSEYVFNECNVEVSNMDVLLKRKIVFEPSKP